MTQSTLATLYRFELKMLLRDKRTILLSIVLPVLVMLAAAGAAASRLKVRLLAGSSSSLAVAVKVSRVSSFTVLSPIGSSTGAKSLISSTVMVMVSLSVRAGVPPEPAETLEQHIGGCKLGDQ